MKTIVNYINEFLVKKHIKNDRVLDNNMCQEFIKNNKKDLKKYAGEVHTRGQRSICVYDNKTPLYFKWFIIYMLCYKFGPLTKEEIFELYNDISDDIQFYGKNKELADFDKSLDRLHSEDGRSKNSRPLYFVNDTYRANRRIYAF